MSILDDLINESKNYRVKDVVIGAFDIGVINSKKTGIATSMRDFGVKGGHPRMKNLGRLEELNTTDIAAYLKSKVLLESSLGMAAVNSSLPDLEENRLKEKNASELVLKHGKDRNVGVIGHFPFVKKLKDEVKNLYVFGKPPLKGELPPEKEPEYLPGVDLAVISGTSFINHTFTDIMDYVSEEAFTIVLGPSAPLTPVLFDYGVNAVCGTQVKDPELLIKYLKQGATFRDLKGKRLVTVLSEDF